jgi:hypothetical protein
VKDVTVRVRKETPIIDGIVDYIGVQISRERAAVSRPSRARVTKAR